MVIFIASLGALITTENLIAMGFGTDVKTLEGFPLRVFKDGGITINSLQIVMLMIAGILFLGLMIYLHRTRSGKSFAGFDQQ